jgi:cell division control protein 6
VSRSEFADLVGMLEVVGLVSSLASLSSASGGSPTKRTFGRSASFGGVGGKGIGGGQVEIAEGVRVDEVLRGLGVDENGEGKGVREEEISAIWERERSRLGREVRAIEKARGSGGRGEVFGDAMED